MVIFNSYFETGSPPGPLTAAAPKRGDASPYPRKVVARRAIGGAIGGAIGSADRGDPVKSGGDLGYTLQ